MRTVLRKAKLRTVEELWKKLGKLCDIFTPEECQNYFKHAGYYGNTKLQTNASYALGMRSSISELERLHYFQAIPVSEYVNMTRDEFWEKICAYFNAVGIENYHAPSSFLESLP